MAAQKWEYKTLEIGEVSFWSGKVKTEELTKQLNNLGQTGWELVSISPMGYAKVGACLVAVLKRPA